MNKNEIGEKRTDRNWSSVVFAVICFCLAGLSIYELVFGKPLSIADPRFHGMGEGIGFWIFIAVGCYALSNSKK